MSPSTLALSNHSFLNETSVYNQSNINKIISEFDNDYFQQQIYQEVRQNNSAIETWHHILGVTGSIVSVFGVFGINIFILEFYLL
jgi:hypothetical protein